MDGMNPFSNDKWIQQYPNTSIIQHHGKSSDHAPMISVYRDSSQGTTSQTGPKPIRRRSRASRRTPTTILNASPNDFRGLVQRFTGCDSKDDMSSVSVVSLPKGPLTIDFSTNGVKEGSSRFTYNNNHNQVRLPPQGEKQMQLVDGRLSDIHAGYGMEDASSVVFESSFLANDRDVGGYNV